MANTNTQYTELARFNVNKPDYNRITRTMEDVEHTITFTQVEFLTGSYAGKRYVERQDRAFGVVWSSGQAPAWAMPACWQQELAAHAAQ